MTSSIECEGNSKCAFGIATSTLGVFPLPPIPNVNAKAFVINPVDSTRFSNKSAEPLETSFK